MAISKKDVEHIANLARIKITDEEKEKFEQELSGILSFIETLEEVDTKDVPPVTGGTSLSNETREDEVNSAFEDAQMAVLGAVPEKERGYVKVKSVFE